MLAAVWWDIHGDSELPPGDHNLWTPNSPPFPGWKSFLCFIGSCYALVIVQSFLFAAFPLESLESARSATIWMSLLLFLFYYVNHIITQRPTWFAGRHGGFVDICAVFCFSLFSFCSTFLPRDGQLLFSGNDYLLDFIYVSAFVTMSHCSFIHRLPKEFHSSIKISVFKEALGKPKEAFVLFCRIVPVLFCLSYVFRLIFTHVHEEVFLLLSHVIALFLLVSYSLWISTGYYVHLHHYIIGYAFTFSCGAYSNDYIVCTFFAFSCASFVEGAARWSCAPLWHKKNEMTVYCCRMVQTTFFSPDCYILPSDDVGKGWLVEGYRKDENIF